MNRSWIKTFLIAVLCSWVLQAQANVVISGTRLIYPAKDREITVKTTKIVGIPIAEPIPPMRLSW